MGAVPADKSLVSRGPLPAQDVCIGSLSCGKPLWESAGRRECPQAGKGSLSLQLGEQAPLDVWGPKAASSLKVQWALLGELSEVQRGHGRIFGGSGWCD